MRFHMGVSFRLKSLKKFIIPFLLGLFAFFGFSKFVNAQSIIEEGYFFGLENSDYDVDSILKTSYFGSDTGYDIVQSLSNINTTDYGYAIFIQLNNTSSALSQIQILLFGNSYDLTSSVYSTNQTSLVMNFTSSSNSNYGRLFSLTPYFNFNQSFFESNYYSMMISCFSDFSNCPSSKPSETNYGGSLTLTKRQFISSTNSNYINNYDSNSNIYVKNNFIYYDSTKDFTLSFPTSDSTRYYRDVMVNSDLVELNDVFPTYLSQQISDNPDNPSSDDSVELKGLSRFVYWFFNPNNRNDILINIYVLLFLFLVGLFTLKIFTIIHNVGWRRR